MKKWGFLSGFDITYISFVPFLNKKEDARLAKRVGDQFGESKPTWDGHMGVGYGDLTYGQRMKTSTASALKELAM